MSDHLDRAAEVLARVGCQPDDEPSFLDREYARALDAAGLLVSPERDAAVAARALRGAAEEVYGDDRAAGPYSHPLSAASWLRERADRVEREAGESDADA